MRKYCIRYLHAGFEMHLTPTTDGHIVRAIANERSEEKEIDRRHLLSTLNTKWLHSVCFIHVEVLTNALTWENDLIRIRCHPNVEYFLFHLCLENKIGYRWLVTVHSDAELSFPLETNENCVHCLRKVQSHREGILRFVDTLLHEWFIQNFVHIDTCAQYTHTRTHYDDLNVNIVFMSLSLNFSLHSTVCIRRAPCVCVTKQLEPLIQYKLVLFVNVLLHMKLLRSLNGKVVCLALIFYGIGASMSAA